MGVGMVLAVDAASADACVRTLTEAGEKAWILGETTAGRKEAVIC